MSLVSDTQDLLNDAGVFWLDNHLYDALNSVQLSVWRETHHDIAVGTMTVTASQEFAAVPSPIMIPQRIRLNDVEWWSTTPTLLERDNREWRTLNEAETHWFRVFDAETFQLIPKPDATYEFDVEGVRYPATEIASGSLDITAPLDVKKAVQYGAAALLALNTRRDLHEVWLDEAARSLQRAKTRYRRRGAPFRRLRPGTGLTHAHQGDRASGRNITGVEYR